MIRVLLRRVSVLERQSLDDDWRAYASLPVEEWPDWALDAFLGYPTEDELERMAAAAGLAQCSRA